MKRKRKREREEELDESDKDDEIIWKGEKGRERMRGKIVTWTMIVTIDQPVNSFKANG